MYHHYLFFGSKSPFGLTEIISFIANIVTILGVIGLSIAYLEYRSKQKEEKKRSLKETLRAIKSIKFQLDTFGEWTNFINGGYSKKDLASWQASQYSFRGNPFNLIYKIEFSYLKTINSLPAVEYFDDEINEALAWTSQWVESFNTMLDDTKEFAYSRDADKNVLLNQKLANNSKLTKEEVAFMDLLVDRYTKLHFETIGDNTTKHLHYWHKKLRDLLDDLEKKTQKKISKLE
jgi:hypothetical protein